MALEMGIQHLRVISDSNLVFYQTKSSFSLKEPYLAPYKMLAQKMKEKFYSFKIQYSQQNENRYADALVALGLQIGFKMNSTMV